MDKADGKTKAQKIKGALKEYKSKMGQLKSKSFDLYKKGIGKIDERKLAEIRSKINQ